MTRGTGTTMQQMLDAPVGALFVWCNSMLYYPKSLAASLARNDLIIVAPSWLNGRMFGEIAVAVIVDHAAMLTLEQRDFVHAIYSYQSQKRAGLN